MQKIHIDLGSWQDLALQATYYYREAVTTKACLIYFHGGGLIYGQREDLPDPYLELLTEAGYSILAVDYPLAPETKLPAILDACQQAMDYYLDHWDKLPGLKQVDYYLMGRSAGGYLALRLAANQADISQDDPQRAQGVVTFYGYYNLQDAQFQVTNRHYRQLARVNDSQVEVLIGKTPRTAGDMNLRYPIYLYARQTGNWIAFLVGSSQEASRLSLTNDDLQQLPPSFIAVAREDTDVPVAQSKRLAQQIPDSELVIADSTTHDFDRVDIDGEGLRVYQALVNWLNTQQ